MIPNSYCRIVQLVKLFLQYHKGGYRSATPQKKLDVMTLHEKDILHFSSSFCVTLHRRVLQALKSPTADNTTHDEHHISFFQRLQYLGVTFNFHSNPELCAFLFPSVCVTDKPGQYVLL